MPRVALGILPVLVSITLFHCGEQAKTTARNAGLEAKMVELGEKVRESKGRLVEVTEGLERAVQMQKMLDDLITPGTAQRGREDKKG